jgi:ferritin-like metal-binding protein YciE
MKLASLQDLYMSELRDLYSSEDQVLGALPKMIKKAASPELRAALENHLEQTRSHVTRLERIFEMHGEAAKKQKCKGMHGVLEESDEMLGKEAAPAVRDAAIISACQRMEHYEIATYGSVRTYAEQIGHERAAAVLQETLDEERAEDQKLTEIAKTVVNVQATRTA